MRSVRPLVSVVTPAYNKVDTLADACDSVLSQTVTNLELIIVDDASTDETPQLVKSYRARDARVTSVTNDSNSRQGPQQWEPRNDGLVVARGQYIAYLDADNVWAPTFLQVLIGALMSNPSAQLAYCRSRNFHIADEVEGVIARDRRQALARGADWVVFGHDELDQAELGREQYVDTNEMVHRSSALNELGEGWRTEHPRRGWVSSHQGKWCPYRRHNDLELVERFIGRFGVEALVLVPEVLVEFFYPGVRPDRRRTQFANNAPPTDLSSTCI